MPGYGPSWIVSTTDRGLTWNTSATPLHFFTGRLGAVRLVQYGQNYRDNRDGYVYAHFPGTEDGNAWFEQNDAMWLGRVRKEQLLDRSAWEVYCGRRTSGALCWSHEDTIAVSVFRFPLHTAVQQVNYEPTLQRFVFG
eukprot:SAG31_NODE_25464_length_461_cov_0.588398_1_plen_137_part_01